MGKAKPQPLDRQHMFNGLKRAHEFSGIGQVSNNLTKLWNKSTITQQARDAADWLSVYNNFVIDAAKTGIVNSYQNYPQVNEAIRKAVGGKRAVMPYFFQFSKNGRRESQRGKKYAKPTESTANRICAHFQQLNRTRINIDYANVMPFNWQMLLMDDNTPYNSKAVQLFCSLDSASIPDYVFSSIQTDAAQKEAMSTYQFTRQIITHMLERQYGSLENVYPSIVKYLFTGQNLNKQTHKQMFWRVFGQHAVTIIEYNTQHFKRCECCGAAIPQWAHTHICSDKIKGLVKCIDCGQYCVRTNSRQIRCAGCQDVYRKSFYARKKAAQCSSLAS